MHVTWSRSRPGFARARILLHALAIGIAAIAAPAYADTLVEGTVAPIVRINVHRGALVLKTWDRDQIAIEGDPSIVVERSPFRRFLGLGSLPIPAVGNAEGADFLPPESFVQTPLSPGVHEQIVISTTPDAPPSPVTITIPANTPRVIAIDRAGALDVENYRSGTLVAFTGGGRLHVAGGGGTAFLQTNRGPIVVEDSTFDRVRARSLAGNITYERCVVHQIETTAVGGSIVFDGGSFEAGLARFESTRGDVAIGSETPSELSAHSASGRIYSSFLAPVAVNDFNGETHATIGGGGPLITAASQSGNVYLYDGSLRTRAMPAGWQMPAAILQRPGIRREPAPGNPERPPARSPNARQVKFRAYFRR